MKAKRSAKKQTTKKKTTENHAPVPSGILLVIGGAENKGESEPEKKKKPSDFVRLQVLETFKNLIPKREPLVEIITTASGNGNETFERYEKALAEVGITNLGHIHHTSRSEILDEPLLERAQNADAFFFSGGDQLKLTGIYGGTEFLTQIKQRYINEPLVVAGTSAGAMAMSTPMIYAGNEEVHELGGNIKLTTGLEFLRDVCIDTHFVHRGRFVRMSQVIITNPTCIGIGIEEDTAIIVRNGIEAEVVGTGLVIIIEGFDIRDSSIAEFTEDKPVTARNLKMHLLSDKCRYIIPQMNPAHK